VQKVVNELAEAICLRSLAKPDELTQPVWFEIGMHTAYLLASYWSDLRDTAVDEQFRSRNVAAIVTCEKYRDLRDLIVCSESA
jgi:hypothetical protein